MEPSSQGKGRAQVVVVEMPIQWLDIGSWPALAETLDVDENDNAIAAPNLVYLDSEDNIVVCQDPEHLISLIGVNDMIVVHTKDATMVCPKSEAQRVKELVGKLKDRYDSKYQ
jgi:mannose-1-phosphate guanylyltransferase